MENVSHETKTVATRRVIVELTDDDPPLLAAIFPTAETSEQNERLEKFLRERLGGDEQRG
jgi:hypothetical protein